MRQTVFFAAACAGADPLRAKRLRRDRSPPQPAGSGPAAISIRRYILTAQDIRDQKFTRFRRSGYQSNEVDAFMRDVLDSYERLEAQTSEAQDEAARLRVLVHDMEQENSARRQPAQSAVDEQAARQAALLDIEEQMRVLKTRRDALEMQSAAGRPPGGWKDLQQQGSAVGPSLYEDSMSCMTVAPRTAEPAAQEGHSVRSGAAIQDVPAQQKDALTDLAEGVRQLLGACASQLERIAEQIAALSAAAAKMLPGDAGQQQAADAKPKRKAGTVRAKKPAKHAAKKPDAGEEAALPAAAEDDALAPAQ